MEKPLSIVEQDARLLASLAKVMPHIVLKEQQNATLKALLEEKKQLVQRLESFLREVERERPNRPCNCSDAADYSHPLMRITLRRQRQRDQLTALLARFGIETDASS